ncbi:MAG: PEP-CTERM sorting domain-containing protein [Candidatus Eisenbacteria bacterium]|nr:PEP-CTERM sorting domain-containing protein [Candidatus Eisenbacteria bacterium]
MRVPRFLPLIAGALLLALVAGPVHAAPMPLDGSWVRLDENMAEGSFFTGNWDWESACNVAFTITDIWVVSDAFEVYDFGKLVFTTPKVPDWDALGLLDPRTAPPYTGDPDLALADGRFSNGLHVFGSGTHSITIRDYHIPPMTAGGNPFPDGTVAFKAACTPEPGTLGLMLLGGVALLALRRKV